MVTLSSPLPTYSTDGVAAEEPKFSPSVLERISFSVHPTSLQKSARDILLLDGVVIGFPASNDGW